MAEVWALRFVFRIGAVLAVLWQHVDARQLSRFGTSVSASPRSCHFCGVERYAYAFYATSDLHLCSSLVNIRALKFARTSKCISFVVVHPTGTLTEEAKSYARLQGAVLVEVDPISGPPKNADGEEQWLNAYYSNVHTKLRVFQLDMYDRLVYLDSDAIILRSLDHLFCLPSVALAAPRAFWLPQPAFTSMLLVIQPKLMQWARIEKHLPPKPGMFDMDILNLEFVNDILLLPNNYALLNNLWEPSDPVIGKPQAHKFGNLSALFDEAYYVHFCLHGKPWFHALLNTTERPYADAHFWDFYKLWWQHKNALSCSVDH